MKINMDKDGNARRTIENSDWKNKDEKYLFELQKFLDITENITDEVLRKEIIAQMLKCDKRVTQLAEKKFEELKNGWIKRKELQKIDNMKNISKKIIIGLLAGIVSGLFSTGGGMIVVPAFIYLLNMEDKKARGTSIFCILPMVITSGIFYYRSNYIDWNISILCAIGGMIGGYIGAKILKKIPVQYLKIVFTIFLIYASYKMLFK